MEKRYGMAGWKQFLQNRRDILCEVDKLLEQTSSRPIKTAHGEAGEAKIREWLSEFLPKKYAVTSGYIIPSVYDDQGTQYHFDVIVYDALESPILWVEGNKDQSTQGKSKAIPAKFVKAVYEVKARITLKSTRDAIEKLRQLKAFEDHLGANFNCAAIFIDLNEQDINRQSIISTLLKGADIRGFWGGAILRCTVDDSATALIQVFNQDNNNDEFKNDKTPLMRPIDDVKVISLEDGNIQLRGGGGAVFTSNGVDTWYVTKQYTKNYFDSNLGVSLTWSRSGFADFSIRILSTLDGVDSRTINNENKLTFGRVFDSLEREEAERQSDSKSNELPYLEIELAKVKGTDNYFVIEKKGVDGVFNLSFSVKNTGNVDAEVSADRYKTSATLIPSKAGIVSEGITLQGKKTTPSELTKTITDFMSDKTPLKFTKRFVYRASTENAKFYCVTVRFEVFATRYSMEIE
jgi:hypothetical protein